MIDDGTVEASLATTHAEDGGAPTTALAAAPNRPALGAALLENGTDFQVWAPRAKKVQLCWRQAPEGEWQRVPASAAGGGYFSVFVEGLCEGIRYRWVLDDSDPLPDPASRFQPEGPHGDSVVVGERFPWENGEGPSLDLSDLVIYELHIGTFTADGTFRAAIERLDHLRDLGITAIEIMPVAQFAGARNWGYDGVGLFAPQSSYGGEENPVHGLKALVDAAHARGIAVILDVVYNHLGPEGNYLSQFGPYFQAKYHTPWGDALNFDGEFSDEVRHFFLQNARQWLREFRFDGLRLDAVHAILDTSAKSFLEELSQLKSEIEIERGRPLYLIAESDLNDPKVLRPRGEGGWGMDAHWADDLHHVIHTLLTGESQGYYQEYGRVEQLAEIYREGVLFHGGWSPARHRRHGRSYAGVERCRLVVCAQNHDQIGNRMTGDRLAAHLDEARLRLAHAMVFLSPGLPMIFMGEEYFATTPFQYFVDHTDPELRRAVQRGRAEEFKAFRWQGEVPDPAAPATFAASRLRWDQADEERGLRAQNHLRRLVELSKDLRRGGYLEEGRVRTELRHLSRDGRQGHLRIWGENGTDRVRIDFNLRDLPTPLMDGEERLDLVYDSAENDSPQCELAPWSARMARGGI